MDFPPESRVPFTMKTIENCIAYMNLIELEPDDRIVISILRNMENPEKDVVRIECTSLKHSFLARRDYIKSWSVDENVNPYELLEYANSLVAKLHQETIRNSDV